MFLVVALALSAAQPAPVRVASTGWSFVGIEPALGEVFLERFVTELEKRGRGRLSITTQRDVSQLLGLDRQRQLLGCAESACLAELAGALGVEVVISGTLAKTAAGYTATLKALDTTTGRARISESTRAEDEAALQDWLDGQARAFAAVLLGEGPAATSSPSTVVKLVPGMVGVLLLGGGGLTFGLSKQKADALDAGGFTQPSEVTTLARDGRMLETTGVAMLVGGGVAVAATAAWLLLSPSRDVTASVVVDGAAGHFVLSGRLP